MASDEGRANFLCPFDALRIPWLGIPSGLRFPQEAIPPPAIHVQVAVDETKWYFGVVMKTARPPSKFHVVVEAVDGLSVEEQETLVAVLNRRLADRRRAELAEDVREGRREFKRGALRPTTPDKIMKEILS